MPNIQMLGTPGPSTGSLMGEGFSKGFSEGFGNAYDDNRKLSLSQKMNALEDQRKVNQQQAIVSRQAENLRKLGGESAQFADIYEATGGDATTAMKFMEYGFGKKQQQQQNAMQNVQQIGAQQQGTGLPQYDMATQQGVPPQMLQPAQFPKIQQQQAIQQMSPQAQPGMGDQSQQPIQQQPMSEKKSIKRLEEYAKDINPNFQDMKGPPRDKVLKEAEMKRNADIQDLKFDQKEKQFERAQDYLEDAPKRAFIDEAQKRLEGWHKQKTNLQYIKDHAKEVGKSAGLRKKLASYIGVQESTFLSDPEQVMDKMATQLSQGISSTFPGKILMSELEVFMRSNPSMLNSPTAMEKIASIGLLNGQLTEDTYKEIRNLRKTYKDKDDLYDAVSDKMQPKFDKLNEEINQFLSGKTQKEFTKLPSPQEAKGKLFRVKQTGQLLRSDGKKWQAAN
jgi:hypothetical protein